MFITNELKYTYTECLILEDIGGVSCSNQLTLTKSEGIVPLGSSERRSAFFSASLYNMVSMVLVPYAIKPNFDIVPRGMVTSLRVNRVMQSKLN
ncbi:hypothetical protein BpHYR1_030418 [Brachionus plicatilis]|uniref:Uncharacterized protein n=1 Tax=Brachionus plicatilis TaxID=10195 RepID=A0A3M7SM28_BRAPC|nr:hypothetical protein BpHYR1_030418 [Brachionus plicatilis]